MSAAPLEGRREDLLSHLGSVGEEDLVSPFFLLSHFLVGSGLLFFLVCQEVNEGRRQDNSKRKRERGRYVLKTWTKYL